MAGNARSGRRPKPTALAVIQGGAANKKAVSKRANEPVPASPKRVPTPPRHMTDVAKEFWKENAKELWNLGLLTRSDMHAWEQTCEAYADWREAMDGKKKGLYVQDPTVPQKKNGTPMFKKAIINPYIKMERDAHKRFVNMLDRFGMNPSSRAKVGGMERDTDDGEDEGEGKWQGLFPIG